ncbi:hypothetical protein [Roseimaritima ulvae]|uniref:Uncharacterized protein n=1 Tax=Roseimaritima ulvae TaxID=980254 RepID=A0A5B9R0X6_9BACT|nr:hypothetical protein [Roseimaritima ulvae]QEG39881.1 hypothetical protein UC8_18800 [Roseimaritima ulvae]
MLKTIHFFGVSLFLACLPTACDAQDFETIERRLGEIVADGELSLEQAQVMLHALRVVTHHRRNDDHPMREMLEQFERYGVDETKADHARHALEQQGIHGENLHHAMGALLRIVQRMQASDHDFDMPEAMERHLHEELSLSAKQIDFLIGLANRVAHAGSSNEHREANAEEILQWIESVRTKLKQAIESNKLSGQDASRKWQFIKQYQLAPKLKAATERGELDEEHAKRIWHEIEAYEMTDRKAD